MGKNKQHARILITGASGLLGVIWQLVFAWTIK
jgi:hypothetical protein